MDRLDLENDNAGMSTPTPDFPLPMSAPAEQVFPTLTPQQIARVATHGRVRPVRSGEVLISAGDRVESFFVVTAGSVVLTRPSEKGEEIVAVLRPGKFTGELILLS